MAHTRLYSTRHNLQMELEVRDMAVGMAADTGHSLSAQAIEAKVTGLLKAGYPLSEEQITAIRTVTSSGGRVAIIEGAAGSGKTTTLRPIADLYREHGQSIIATAVAWRTAVALGNDVDTRPFCVDKLLRLAARGGIEIDGNTTIIVDEVGMLSTRQAHHILKLSERHGAKIVFAGDTQQQQPVEAGPGLRLIRDAVGSVRVDRIRRQKADLEDILTHVQGETPETARLLASSMAEERRTRILTYYENMKGKLVFTPWQVAASEALRDGDAASAIAALHLRGRFHIGYDEEKTLTGLVDDWDRYQRANPDKSSVVLARTRAEVRALSHLMRDRRFTALPGVWIDRVHARNRLKIIVLDMDSSVSPTHGEQEGTAYNGHFGCTCYHPLFVFNQFGDLERCALRPGNVHSAHEWRDVLEPVVARYRDRLLRRYFRGDAAFALPGIYESSKPKASGTRSACRLTECSRTASAICSSAPSADRPRTCAGITPASAIGLPLGRSPVGSSPRSSGIQVNCTRASALS